MSVHCLFKEVMWDFPAVFWRGLIVRLSYDESNKTFKI